MKHLFGLVCFCIVAAGVATTNARAGDPHEHEDIIVGHTGSGALSVEYEFSELSELFPTSGLFNGWSGDEPGLEHLEDDEPSEDFFTLTAGADIVFEVVSIDDALIGNPLTDSLDAPGEQFTLGDHELHTHIDWLIDADDPGFNPLQTVWEVEFKLIDLGTTNYSESPVYTWGFTPVPEPATAMMMLAGCAFISRRKRG